MAIRFRQEDMYITEKWRKKMKKKTKKLILEFLEFWPLTIVIPLMLISIVLGAALGWGG
jgi:hypothetical protein